MPSWCFTTSTLYKGLVTLILALIALEYLFGSIIETKKWETIFTFNSTRAPAIDKNVQLIHSPLIKSLLSANKNVKSNKTSTVLTQDLFSRLFNTTSLLGLNNSVIVNNASTNIGAYFEVNVTTATPPISEEPKALNVTTLPICPDIPPNSLGRVEVILDRVPTIQQLEHRFTWLTTGGHGTPHNCRARKRVALVIPFRCRSEHLLLFLQHMHPFLHRQNLDYTIFVVEQAGEGPFNRAMLMNVGYVEALKSDGQFNCFIFHDIDLLPEDERNMYTCPEQPRHMSAAVDVFKYRLPYNGIFGGVSAISTQHFRLLNGFSNLFWGWGGEDDDMANRVRYHNLHISRYPNTIARYTMLTHKKEKASPNRYDILKEGKKKFESEGLNDLKYKLRNKKRHLLYTWILAEIHPPS